MIREHLVDQNQHKELGHGIIGNLILTLLKQKKFLLTDVNLRS